jgi:DNA-binding transcriptional ArsR family regulator
MCELTCNLMVAYNQGMNSVLKESRTDSAADRVFRALADPSRRRLLDRMRIKGGRTLNELCEGLDMTRQAVTKHLTILEGANLVVLHWQGRERRHYLNPVPIHAIAKRWILPFEHVRLGALHNLKKQLED